MRPNAIIPIIIAMVVATGITVALPASYMEIEDAGRGTGYGPYHVYFYDNIGELQSLDGRILVDIYDDPYNGKKEGNLLYSKFYNTSELTRGPLGSYIIPFIPLGELSAYPQSDNLYVAFGAKDRSINQILFTAIVERRLVKYDY